MIYDSDDGHRGNVFSNGVEVDRCIKRVDTETGEIVCSVEPTVIEDGKVVYETIVLENVTFEPLPRVEKPKSTYELPENPTPADFLRLLKS